MSQTALPMTSDFKISYGIYTVERTPRGAKRRAKWDLHSMAEDRKTAEDHAKSLAAQPYFDHIEVQEFRICARTRQRSVRMVKTYSRKTSLMTYISMIAAVMAVIGFIALMIV